MAVECPEVLRKRPRNDLGISGSFEMDDMMHHHRMVDHKKDLDVTVIQAQFDIEVNKNYISRSFPQLASTAV